MKDWGYKKKDCKDCRKGSCDRSHGKDCKKIYCFGDWDNPRPPKCPYPCKFEECNFDEIPTGSLYFAEHWDYYGALRSGASKQKYSLIGIVLQLSDKRDKHDCKTKPYVLTVKYNGVVRLFQLCDLMNDPLIISQAVRPKFRACNKCVDKEQNDYLYKIAREYLGKPFEENSPQIARSIFDIPASNPNECSYTDTELVYRVLYRAALIGDCCPEETTKEYCMKACKQSECSCNSDPCKCNKKPCEKTCCAYSSSTAECKPCDKIDCYRASAVSICDFLTDNNLDLRWYAPLVQVYTSCVDPVKRSEAVNHAFAQQMRQVTKNVRDLVGCWLGGDSFCYWKGNSCSPCEKRSSYCGKEVTKKHESSSCAVVKKYDCKKKHDHACDQRCDTVLCRNAENMMVTLLLVIEQLINLDNPGSAGEAGIIYRLTDGNLLVAYLQRVIDFMSSICNDTCEKISFSVPSTSYVTYTVGNLLEVPQIPLMDLKVNCEEDICEGARLSIDALKTIAEQLIMPNNTGSQTAPRAIRGDLLVLYFQSVLDYLASLCGKKARQLTYPSVSVQYLSYSYKPLMSPFAPEVPDCDSSDSYALFNKLVSKLGNNS